MQMRKRLPNQLLQGVPQQAFPPGIFPPPFPLPLFLSLIPSLLFCQQKKKRNPNRLSPNEQNCKKIPRDPVPPVQQICGSRGLPGCPADKPACVNTPEQLAAGCTTAADCPGFCVALGQFCGGIAAFQCPAGQTCVDDPRDDCDPQFGGADCSGVCVNFDDPGNVGGGVLS